MEKGAGFGALF